MFVIMSLICHFLPPAPTMESDSQSVSRGGDDDCPDWKVLSLLGRPRLQPFYGSESDYRSDPTYLCSVM